MSYVSVHPVTVLFFVHLFIKIYFLCTCLYKFDCQIIVPYVLIVTTHLHIGLYNGFANYIPQVS